jgi:hypothetical protein
VHPLGLQNQSTLTTAPPQAHENPTTIGFSTVGLRAGSPMPARERKFTAAMFFVSSGPRSPIYYSQVGVRYGLLNS